MRIGKKEKGKERQAERGPLLSRGRVVLKVTQLRKRKCEYKYKSGTKQNLSSKKMNGSATLGRTRRSEHCKTLYALQNRRSVLNLAPLAASRR